MAQVGNYRAGRRILYLDTLIDHAQEVGRVLRVASQARRGRL
jgi:hypothetical protein